MSERTDREVLRDMFQRMAAARRRPMGADGETVREAGDTIEVEGGYVGFFSRFTFSESGDLINVEAYE